MLVKLSQNIRRIYNTFSLSKKKTPKYGKFICILLIICVKFMCGLSNDWGNKEEYDKIEVRLVKQKKKQLFKP